MKKSMIAALVAAMVGVAGCESLQVHKNSPGEIASVEDLAKRTDFTSYILPPSMIDAVTLAGTRIVISPKSEKFESRPIPVMLKGEAHGPNGYTLNMDRCQLYATPSIYGINHEASGEKSAFINFNPKNVICAPTANRYLHADMESASIQVMPRGMSDMIKVRVVSNSGGEYAELPAAIPVTVMFVKPMQFVPKAVSKTDFINDIASAIAAAYEKQDLERMLKSDDQAGN